MTTPTAPLSSKQLEQAMMKKRAEESRLENLALGRLKLAEERERKRNTPNVTLEPIVLPKESVGTTASQNGGASQMLSLARDLKRKAQTALEEETEEPVVKKKKVKENGSGFSSTFKSALYSTIVTVGSLALTAMLPSLIGCLLPQVSASITDSYKNTHPHNRPTQLKPTQNKTEKDIFDDERFDPAAIFR